MKRIQESVRDVPGMPMAVIVLCTILAQVALMGCVRPMPSGDNTTTTANPQNAEPVSPTASVQTTGDQPGEMADTSSAPSSEPPLEQGEGDFFILHSIQSGDTLGTIAEQYETSVAQLMSLNQIEDSDFIIVGQTLRVPGSEFKTLVSPSFEIIPDSELVYGPSRQDI